jgi:hypothetical protein
MTAIIADPAMELCNRRQFPSSSDAPSWKPVNLKESTMHQTFQSQKVGEVEVFYREAGPKDGPVVLLLHGFPTSSHMFRNLIPELAGT